MVDRQLIRRSTKATNKELARKIEAKVLYQLTKGKWYEKNPANEVFFSDVWEKYLREDAKYKAPITYDRAQQCAKRFLPMLGNLKLSQITASILSTYKTKRFEDGVTTTTVVHELSFIRRVFSLCKREWQLCKQSPFEFFTMPKENPPRVRFLKPGEFDKILVRCPSWLKPIAILSRYTGLRRRNVLTLTWSQVDFESG
jgi:integrase